MGAFDLDFPPLPGNGGGRDAVTGRFTKGHVPATKGKKWDEWMGKRAQRRAARGWKNLELYRRRPQNAGRPKKMVVGVGDDGAWALFSSTSAAGERSGYRKENIARCCRLNGSGGENTDHRYKGVRWYFEADDVWMGKVRVDS